MSIHDGYELASNFPSQEVESCIREALRDQMGAQSVLRPRVASVCEPEIDSLVVVEVICAIEEVLGVSLPSLSAPCGGYDDVEACVSDLLRVSQAVWGDLIKKKEHHHG